MYVNDTGAAVGAFIVVILFGGVLLAETCYSKTTYIHFTQWGMLFFVLQFVGFFFYHVSERKYAQYMRWFLAFVLPACTQIQGVIAIGATVMLYTSRELDIARQDHPTSHIWLYNTWVHYLPLAIHLGYFYMDYEDVVNAVNYYVNIKPIVMSGIAAQIIFAVYVTAFDIQRVYSEDTFMEIIIIGFVVVMILIALLVFYLVNNGTRMKVHGFYICTEKKKNHEIVQFLIWHKTLSSFTGGSSTRLCVFVGSAIVTHVVMFASMFPNSSVTSLTKL